MREKYESLSVTVLREVAKARGLRHLSGLKKKELVELMLREDEKAASENQEDNTEEKQIQTTEDGKEKQIPESEDGKEKQTQITEVGKEKHISEGGREKKKEDKKVQAVGERKTRSSEERKEQPPEERRVQPPEEQRLQAPEERRQPSEERRIQAPEERRQPSEERRMQPRETERRPSRIITVDGIEIDNPELDSGVSAHGILEVMPDGYGFIRCENYLPGDHDVYVSPSQIRKFGLKTGDIIHGNTRVKTQQEKFSALLYIKSINGNHPSEILKRPNFEDLTPIFPNERIRLETDRSAVAMRIMDVVSPIGKGQRGMIVSPPKAGKTTLLRMLGMLMTPTQGEIQIKDMSGNNITDITAKKAAIGYLSGNTKLYQRFSIREYLQFLGQIYECSEQEIKERIDKIIDILDMGAFADNHIGKLSTGQTQRASIARCLMADPLLYILDEPTLGLDILSADAIIRFMKEQKSRGRTVLYSTHYLEEAEVLCDRIYMICSGRIAAHGTPEELKRHTNSQNLRAAFHSIYADTLEWRNNEEN